MNFTKQGVSWILFGSILAMPIAVMAEAPVVAPPASVPKTVEPTLPNTTGPSTTPSTRFRRGGSPTPTTDMTSPDFQTAPVGKSQAVDPNSALLNSNSADHDGAGPSSGGGHEVVSTAKPGDAKKAGEELVKEHLITEKELSDVVTAVSSGDNGPSDLLNLKTLFARAKGSLAQMKAAAAQVKAILEGLKHSIAYRVTSSDLARNAAPEEKKFSDKAWDGLSTVVNKAGMLLKANPKTMGKELVKFLREGGISLKDLGNLFFSEVNGGCRLPQFITREASAALIPLFAEATTAGAISVAALGVESYSGPVLNTRERVIDYLKAEQAKDEAAEKKG